MRPEKPLAVMRLAVKDGACRAADIGDTRRLELLHVVGWHHGAPKGSGTASPEALALMKANSLEVDVKERLEGPGLSAA